MPSSFRIHRTAMLAVLLAASWRPADAFVDRSAELGVNVTPGGGDYGHGCAFVDIDNDGVLELYVTMFIGQPNLLFSYDPQTGQFVDIAPARGCADILDTHSVAWANYDNDSDQDLFVADFQGPNRLYENDGVGNFTDVAPALSMDVTDRCYSAAWGDYDNDGYLDLFVCVWARNTDTESYSSTIKRCRRVFMKTFRTGTVG